MDASTRYVWSSGCGEEVCMRIRYDVIVQTSSNGVRKAEVIFNHEPLRPGSVADVFNDIVLEQWLHVGYGYRSYPRGVTTIPVSGIRRKGVGLDGTDIVWMWSTTTKVAVVVKVVYHVFVHE
jgi:hypothetical protein